MKSTLLLFVFVLLEVSLCADYYWRDFDIGLVPDDAFQAARYRGNIGPFILYVGQGHVLDGGVIPSAVQNSGLKGVTEIHMPWRGYSVVMEKFNKILCGGPKNYFRWIPVTSSTLRAQTANKTLVIGGFEDNQFLYIGRIKDAIGKVINVQTPESARFSYGTDREKSSDSYDILTCEDII